MKVRFVAALLVSFATCVNAFAPVRTVRGVPARSTVSKDEYGMNSATIRYSWQQPQNSYGAPAYGAQGQAAYGAPAQGAYGSQAQNSYGAQGNNAFGAQGSQNQFGNQGGGGALPYGWSEENDGQGNTYYYNQQTGESAWERPGGMQQQHQQQQVSDSAQNLARTSRPAAAPPTPPARACARA